MFPWQESNISRIIWVLDFSMGGAEVLYRIQPPGFPAGSPGWSSLWSQCAQVPAVSPPLPVKWGRWCRFSHWYPSMLWACYFWGLSIISVRWCESTNLSTSIWHLNNGQMMNVKYLQLQLGCCCSTLRGWSSEGPSQKSWEGWSHLWNM